MTAYLPDAETGETDGIAWLHARLPGDLDYRRMQYALAVAGREDLKAVNSHLMFNIAKTRLSMPEAVTAARAWFKSRELPNGLFIWKGHAHGTFMSESIGIAALITEFLMQSVDDTLRVFPCWPEDQDAAFAGLRAQGGFLVTAEQKDKKVVRLDITSTVGGTLRLVSPWKKVQVNGKALIPDKQGIVSVETKPGETLTFRRRTGQTAR